MRTIFQLNRVQRCRALAAAIRALAVLAGLLLAAPSTTAATLNVVDGQLLGAFDVNVGGTLYDVQFLDGTCISLYSGCGPSTEFAFTTLGDATLASQALIDQVFLDSVDLGLFDSNPSLINGCAETTLCGVLTPYELGQIGIPTIRFAVVATVHSLNVGSGEPFPNQVATLPSLRIDEGANGPAPPGCISPACDSAVYAVWTPVPEPGTALLMGLGLLVMSARMTREPVRA